MRRFSAVMAAVAIAAGLSAADRMADPQQGRVLFERRCTGCHALDNVRAAPRLRAVFGRPAARDPQFPYSDALKGSKLTWDEATLDRWLADPEALVPGNDMGLRLGSASERADIIAYLKQLGGK